MAELTQEQLSAKVAELFAISEEIKSLTAKKKEIEALFLTRGGAEIENTKYKQLSFKKEKRSKLPRFLLTNRVFNIALFYVAFRLSNALLTAFFSLFTVENYFLRFFTFSYSTCQLTLFLSLLWSDSIIIASDAAFTASSIIVPTVSLFILSLD